VAALSMALAFLAGCGGSSSSTVPPPSGPTVNNTQAIQVKQGPANNYANGIFTDVTICVPGSSSCQDIPNVLVDTGSFGLRLLDSLVTVALPQSPGDSSGNVLRECQSFADGSYVWGPVATADIQMAGEKASTVPIQLISASDTPAAPSSCGRGGGANDNTVATLGANGILGIGPFQQDCGSPCAGSSPPALYYVCPSSGCSVASSVPLLSQLQNPVWLFPQDNNGLLITLPSVPAGGAPTVSGSLIFGIGTQSNNGLGSAGLYTTDSSGSIATTFKGTNYSGTFDTGSNALYVLDAATLGSPIVDCPAPNASFYCTASTQNYSATNTGVNGTSAQISFNIADADTLISSNNAAFNDLAGANPGNFDWGLPFFFGRPVFVGIEGQNSPTGVMGPYWAF
jgi:hypothetical protein